MIQYVKLTEGRGGISRVEKIDPREPDLLLSLRKSGDMLMRENRLDFVSRLSETPGGRKVSPPVMVKQVHSKRVVIADEIPGVGEESGAGGDPSVEADGIVTTDRRLSLGVSVADCMPIYLFSGGSASVGKTAEAVFGIVHSGWKGTGIAAEALKLAAGKFGVGGESFTAVLGPSIRSCCYRVDEERGNVFASAWGAQSVRRVRFPRNEFRIRRMVAAPACGMSSGTPAALHTSEEGTYLDLVEANIKLLEQTGVKDIRIVDACTHCDSRFGSFRREGPESFTHMLAMIAYFQ